jgi:hypothetical protein
MVEVTLGVARIGQQLLQQLHIGLLVVHDQDAGTQDGGFVHGLVPFSGVPGEWFWASWSAWSSASMNSLTLIGLVR